MGMNERAGQECEYVVQSKLGSETGNEDRKKRVESNKGKEDRNRDLEMRPVEVR